jgi:hypothetical protein
VYFKKQKSPETLMFQGLQGVEVAGFESATTFCDSVNGFCNCEKSRLRSGGFMYLRK